MSPRTDWNFPSQAPPTRRPSKWTAAWKQSSDGPDWEWSGLYGKGEWRQCHGHWGHCGRPSPRDWSWPCIHLFCLKREGAVLSSRQSTRGSVSIWAVMWTLTTLGPPSEGAMVLTHEGWLALWWILRPWSPMWHKATSQLATGWMNSRFMSTWMTGQSLVTPFTRRWTRNRRLLLVSPRQQERVILTSEQQSSIRSALMPLFG